MKIHPTSVLSPDVELGPDVEIGPYCLIQGKVKIGKGTFVEGHATVGCRSGILEIGWKISRFSKPEKMRHSRDPVFPGIPEIDQ